MTTSGTIRVPMPHGMPVDKLDPRVPTVVFDHERGETVIGGGLE